ncbi:MAG: dihydrofolate reductase family protein [Anaerolineaceae bacterium]|nr:dihydrofolate reductase family protein [Anaerolineaceae bacterium]
MGKVIVSLSMSLDGFIAGLNDGPDNPLGDGGESLFKWYSSGDTNYTWPDGQMESRVSTASAAYLRQMVGTIGAFVTGRRTFEIAKGWGGRHPLDVPVFVVTHHIQQNWVDDNAPFIFVPDGVASAVEQAKVAAGEKNVAVGAASIAQQCLTAGLLDEINIDLAPVLLTGGVRLFDHLGTAAVELERIRIVNTPDVTHLTFRVLKRGM